MRCRNAEAMIGWLRDVIGFAERVAYRDGSGAIHHAELAYGSSILMLGQCRDDEYGKLVGDIGGRRTDAIYIAVDDYGSRAFACRDPQGNLRSFGTYSPKAHEKPLPG